MEITQMKDCVKATFPDAKAGWEQWVLVRGDAHFDSASSNSELEIRHLKLAKERDAGIIDLGDLFDAMQGKNDRRRRAGSSIQDVEMDDYFDRLVDAATERYAPYAKNFWLLLMGNHEDSVLNYGQTNLTNRLAKALREEGSPVLSCGLEAWLRFKFLGSTTTARSRDMFCLHGYGGGGPVTKGAIQANRRQTWINADIIASGHTHQAFHLPYRRLELNQNGIEVSKRTDHIQVSGYKERDGWNKSKGHSPECRTAFWIRWYWRSDDIHRQVIEVEE